MEIVVPILAESTFTSIGLMYFSYYIQIYTYAYDFLSYAYDFLGRVTQVQYPDSSSISYSFDDTNNKVTFTNGRIQYQDQSTVSFTYDLNSNRTRMDDNAPNTGDYVEYSHDYWNRLVTETRHISTDNYPVSYEYDVGNKNIVSTASCHPFGESSVEEDSGKSNPTKQG